MLLVLSLRDKPSKYTEKVWIQYSPKRFGQIHMYKIFQLNNV